MVAPATRGIKRLSSIVEEDISASVAIKEPIIPVFNPNPGIIRETVRQVIKQAIPPSRLFFFDILMRPYLLPKRAAALSPRIV